MEQEAHSLDPHSTIDLMLPISSPRMDSISIVSCRLSVVSGLARSSDCTTSVMDKCTYMPAAEMAEKIKWTTKSTMSMATDSASTKPGWPAGDRGRA